VRRISTRRFWEGNLPVLPGNATLIARKFLRGFEGLELRGSVYNLFDKEYTVSWSEFIPYGLSQPGINFLVEVRYKF